MRTCGFMDSLFVSFVLRDTNGTVRVGSLSVGSQNRAQHEVSVVKSSGTHYYWIIHIHHEKTTTDAISISAFYIMKDVSLKRFDQ